MKRRFDHDAATAANEDKAWLRHIKELTDDGLLTESEASTLRLEFMRGRLVHDMGYLGAKPAAAWMKRGRADVSRVASREDEAVMPGCTRVGANGASVAIDVATDSSSAAATASAGVATPDATAASATAALATDAVATANAASAASAAHAVAADETAAAVAASTASTAVASTAVATTAVASAAVGTTPVATTTLNATVLTTRILFGGKALDPVTFAQILAECVGMIADGDWRVRAAGVNFLNKMEPQYWTLLAPHIFEFGQLIAHLDDEVRHAVSKLGQVLIYIKRELTLHRWAKARAFVRDVFLVRPYARFWYEYVCEKLCAPGCVWAERDRASFEDEFI